MSSSTAAAAQPAVTSRLTISGEALRDAPARLSSRSLQQMLATLPGWASEDNGLVHVRGVDDGFLYVEDGVPVYDRVESALRRRAGPGRHRQHARDDRLRAGRVRIEVGRGDRDAIDRRAAPALDRRARRRRRQRRPGGRPRLRQRAVRPGRPALNAAAERSDRFLDPVHPDNFHNRGARPLAAPGRQSPSARRIGST